MNSNSTSENAWRILEGLQGEDIATRAAGIEVGAGMVQHALDPSGKRNLLIPVNDSDPKLEDSNSRGISIDTKHLVGSDTRRYIVVRCEDINLNDLFSTVCDEMIAACGEVRDSPWIAVESVLDRWREFLGPKRSPLLTEQQIKGLLAELHVLEGLAAIDPSRALSVWTGADGARHDFTGENTSCEVKASTSVDEIRVHINGLQQLSPPPAELFLKIERMERVRLGGDSLPDALDRLQELGVRRRELYLRCAKVGLDIRDLTSYDLIRFRTLEERLYRVDDSFPRLSTSLLAGHPSANRITRVEYRLDLGAEPPIPLPEATLKQLSTILIESEATR